MERNTVYFREFLTDDHTESFARAMEYLRNHPYTTLVVEPGEYTITTPLAREAQRSVMAGEYGRNPQKVMFNPKYEYSRGIDFYGQTGTVVEAYGVTLMVDGFMEPISLRDCAQVELRGLVIDHKRKPYTRAVVARASELREDGSRECVLELDEACPISEHTPMNLRYLFFDPNTYENIYAWYDTWKLIDDRHVEMNVGDAAKVVAGVTELYTVHTLHSRPTILIERASDVKLTDVTIHSQPGMGVVGNRSHNVTLSGLCVVPSLGHHMSTNTDATHFTSMTGLLRLENCTFEGQGDDFVNVHAYYHQIIERPAPNECYMQEKTPDGTHAQTLDYPDVGDVLELTDRKSMKLVDSFTVLECEPLHDEWKCRVVLDHPLPEDTEGLVLADVTRLPKLEVVGCHARSHFARSILIKTRNVTIENNHLFDVQGSGIHVAPEAWWYEGVSPENVVIRGNRIVKCCYRWTGKGAITVMADTSDPSIKCMKNVLIEDNIIDCPTTEWGIFVRNVDGVTLRRNRVLAKKENVVIQCCDNVKFE